MKKMSVNLQLMIKKYAQFEDDEYPILNYIEENKKNDPETKKKHIRQELKKNGIVVHPSTSEGKLNCLYEWLENTYLNHTYTQPELGGLDATLSPHLRQWGLFQAFQKQGITFLKAFNKEAAESLYIWIVNDERWRREMMAPRVGIEPT